MKELADLFEHLPMVVFWVKDREGRFVRCNQRFEKMHGLEPGGWRGKTDFDFHPPEVSSRYRAEDVRVMELGKAVPNQLWMVPNGKGVLRWWVSSKTPVRDKDGQIIGVAGAMYEVGTQAGLAAPYDRLEQPLRLMHERFADGIKAEDLAKAAGLSVSQFNRVFRSVMGVSAREYLIELKLDAAKDLLARTDRKLSDVAVESGFYDGSEFGKRFKQAEGMTPKEYRKRLQIKPGGYATS